MISQSLGNNKLLTTISHPKIVTASPQFSIIGGENKSAAVQAYRSPRTNLRALVVQTDEPLCSLHIALATESNGGGDGSTQHAWHHPDDGLPHCLEHLVFLGSQVGGDRFRFSGNSSNSMCAHFVHLSELSTQGRA